MIRRLIAALLLLTPATAQAGGEVRILADVLLADPQVFEGGSLIGPPESRATWYGYGGIEPFDGSALLVFSTGEVGDPPMPGTDLGAVGADNDIAGLNLTVRAPDDAHSLRIAVRVLAPDGVDAPEVAGDLARVLIQGDPIALDPWTLDSLAPTSPAMTTARVQELEGTAFAPPDGVGTAWIEAVVPVAPGAQLAVRIEARDGADSAFGDLVLLADGLRFDSGVPEDLQPGHPPLLTGVAPERIAEDMAATVLLSGRDLPPDLQVELTDAAGVTVLHLADEALRWRSAEQVELDLPALEPGLLGVRVVTDGGSIRWDEALLVQTPAPRVVRVRPDVGPATGGGLVAVTGVGFHDVSSVSLGGSEVASWSAVSPELLEFVVPPGDPGPTDLSIFAAGGFVEAPSAYSYQQQPDAAGDDDDDGGGPTPAGCVAAGAVRPSASGWLAVFVLLGAWRARRGGPPRACA